MRNITFNGKEEYLAYRSEWKAEYKKISQIIRGLKREISEAQRNRQYAGASQAILRKWRIDATDMLEERKASKIRAQEQYLAERAKRQEMVTI